jgi:hypothetical protein
VLWRATRAQAAGKLGGVDKDALNFALSRFKKTHAWARKGYMSDEARLVATLLAKQAKPGSFYRRPVKPKPRNGRTGTA